MSRAYDIADVTGTGVINMAAVTLLLRYVVGHPVILGPQRSEGESVRASSGPVEVSVLGANAAPGGYVDVVLRLDANPGINVLELHLNYDASVLEPVT